jgi:hypothetical protein
MVNEWPCVIYTSHRSLLDHGDCSCPDARKRYTPAPEFGKEGKMPPSAVRAKLVCVPYLLLAASALASGGCLAVAVGAGAAGAAAVGYTYYRGGVGQDYAADFNTAWAAVHLALADLQMSAQGMQRDSEHEGSIDSTTGEGKNVHIALETRPGKVPADGPITQIHVRVGLVGDRTLSERLLGQIQMRLTAPPQPVRLPAAASLPQTAPPPLASTAEPPTSWARQSASGK